MVAMLKVADEYITLPSGFYISEQVGPFGVDCTASPRFLFLLIDEFKELCAMQAERADLYMLSSVQLIADRYPGRILVASYWLPRPYQWPLTFHYLSGLGFRIGYDTELEPAMQAALKKDRER